MNPTPKTKYWLITLIVLLAGLWAYNAFPTTPQTQTPPVQHETRETPQPLPATNTPLLENPKSPVPVAQPALATTTPTPEIMTERFVVPLSATTTAQVVDKLFDEGFIKNKADFTVAFTAKAKGTTTPGGYKLSKEMSASQIADILHRPPYMKWVLIPPGVRKEEIAELLGSTLGWSANAKQKWITTYTAMNIDYLEGTYFPDSYLIPLDESPLAVANRIIAHFNERFAPYISEFNKQNIKWTTGLTFASIVQREAANATDTPLIAGILWNRIEKGMPLQTDATLQYARGNTGSGWWAPITVADKQIDSPYNTYKNKGLPPHPIANPGIAAIEATLHPAQTECIYYLHDKNHVTHCAVTYEEHQANIEKYLKGN